MTNRSANPQLLALPFILLVVAVVSLTSRDLLAGLANNFAALEIVRDLPGIQPENGLPKCGPVGSYSRARRWLDTATALDPGRLVTRLNHGRLAWLEGKCRDSERIYENVLAARPGDYRAAYWLYWLGGASHDPVTLGISSQDLAEFAGELGRQADRLIAPDAVIVWYELSFRLAPNQSLAYQINNIYRSAGQVEKAFYFLAEVQARYSEQTPEHWWATGEIASLKSDWNAATKAFQRAVSLTNDPYDYLLEQATALYRLGDWGQEEQAYLQAIKARPGSIYPYIGIGQIRRRVGDFELALVWYQKAESISPDHFFPKFVIGELYLEYGHLELAREYLEETILLDPQYANSYLYLARVYFESGKIELAIDVLDRGLSISETPHPEWLLMLGDWRLAIGDKLGAIQAYQQALSTKPDDLSIQEKINLLTDFHDSP